MISHTPPPKQFLPVVEKTKECYKNWIAIHRNMPRTERFGIGLKIETLFLELLELLRKATYTSIFQKPPILETAISKTDGLRFFLQIAWETKLIPNNQFIELGQKVEDIGRMVNGWRIGILAKNSPK